MDDPWLSGQILTNGIAIWRVAGGPAGSQTDAGNTEGLRQMVYQNDGRPATDTLIIEYFRGH